MKVLQQARKRIFALLIVCSVLFVSVGPKNIVYAAADSDVITIYHTNDMHASVISGDITLSQVASLKKTTPNSLLLDAGDATQGLPIATISEGNSVVQVMNAAGYDAMTLGNHEFDFGQEALLKNLQTANFSIVSCNLGFDDRVLDGIDELVSDYVIKEVGGKKIAIFGITTPETAVTANPSKTVGISFGDIAESVKAVMEQIDQENPDAVICLSHCGWSSEDTGSVSNTIANAGNGEIDLIIDGHSHETFMGSGAKIECGTMIVQTGSSLSNVGKVTMSFDGDEVTVSSEALDADYFASVPNDAEADALIDKIKSEVSELGSQVIGKTKTGLYSGDKSLVVSSVDENGNKLPIINEDGTLNTTTITRSVARYGETNTAALVADAKRWCAKNVLAGTIYDSDDYYTIGIICGGGVRTADTPAGDLTMEQLLTVLPFGGDTDYVLISPKTLYQMVEVGVSSLLYQDKTTGEIYGGSSLGRYLIPSGFSFTIDYDQPAQVYTVTEETAEDGTITQNIERTVQGTRCQEIRLDDGSVLDRNDTEKWIILPTGSYNLSGGDNYWCFIEDGYEIIANGPGDAENTVEYISYLMSLEGNEDGFAYPFSSGRIKTVNFSGKTFDVDTTVIADMKYAENAEVEVYVNGKKYDTYVADENGSFTIKGLKVGPQEITLKSGNVTSDVYYIDNTLGFNEIIFVSDKALKTAATKPATEPATKPTTKPATKPADAAETKDLAYTVVKGDTISSIAINYYGNNLNRALLRSYNSKELKKTAGSLKPGMTIYLPAKLGSQSRIAKPVAAKGEKIYTVKAGDTLGKIAAATYGSSSKYILIYDRNKDRLTSANLIYAGQKIVLPK